MVNQPNVYEVYALMADLLGIDIEDGTDEEYDALEEMFESRYGVSLENFEAIVNLLLPRIKLGQGPITKNWYMGFTNLDQDRWLLKVHTADVNLKGI